MSIQIDPYDMSDDDLEAAFKAARAEQSSASQDLQTDDSGIDDDIDTDENDEILDEGEDNSSASEENEDNDGTEQLDDEQDSGPDVGDKTDKETKTTDDNTADTQDKSKVKVDDSVKAPVVRKFKANGQEFEFTQEEMEAQFPRVFGQAMDYTRKLQAIAPHRKTIDAITQAGLTHEDINFAIDVLKGDKAAISELLKRKSIDALELTTSETTYTPNDYGRDSRTLAFHDVINDIKADPEYSVTGKILESEWDDSSWQTLSSDPEKIRKLHIDVKSGLYAKIQPIASKLKLFETGTRKSDLDYYLLGAQKYFADEEAREIQQRTQAEANARLEAEQARQARIAQAKAQDAQRKTSAQAAQARKSAAVTATATKRSGGINYLEASDEEFEDWYKKLQNQQ